MIRKINEEFSMWCIRMTIEIEYAKSESPDKLAQMCSLMYPLFNVESVFKFWASQ